MRLIDTSIAILAPRETVEQDMRTTRRMPGVDGPVAAASALVLASILALAGCAQSAPADLDGDYFGANRGTPGTVRIEGDTVTFEGFECPVGSPATFSWNAETSVGTLDADRTEVTWTQAGAWSGTTSFAVVGDGIDLGGFVFSDLESEAGAGERALMLEKCAASG